MFPGETHAAVDTFETCPTQYIISPLSVVLVEENAFFMSSWCGFTVRMGLPAQVKEDAWACQGGRPASNQCTPRLSS
jgi:hypothetical protein